MSAFVMPLVLGLDTPSLTMSLVNIASPHGEESALADSVEAAVRAVPHLDVERTGDTVVASTGVRHSERVMVVARLGCAPSQSEPLAYVEMGDLHGPGACGAKGALATVLKAAAVGGYTRDVVFVFSPDGRASVGVPSADFALLAVPTESAVVGAALDHPLARRLIALTDASPVAGDPVTAVPAVAFGPGDPSVTGTPDEFVPTAQLTQCEFVLRQWLTTE